MKFSGLTLLVSLWEMSCNLTLIPVFLDMDYKHYVDDSLMRFFDHCERFVNSVENNKTALNEVHRFKSSSEMDAARRKIANRLQIPYDQFTPGDFLYS